MSKRGVICAMFRVEHCFNYPMKRIPEKITCRTGDRRRFSPFGTFFGSLSYRASIRRGRGRGAFVSCAGAFSALKPAAPARSLPPFLSPVDRPAMWRARWLRFRACCSRNRGVASVAVRARARDEEGEGEKAVFVVIGGSTPRGSRPK